MIESIDYFGKAPKDLKCARKLPLYRPINLWCSEKLFLSAETYDEPSTWKASEQGLEESVLVNQPELSARMRAVLVDWLMEVSSEFFFTRETFHLAVSCVDRYLLKRPVPRCAFQLLGITCLFLSSKLEEVSIPPKTEFLRATDNAFTMEQFNQIEVQVCTVLNWKLFSITANAWMNYLTTEWDTYIQRVPDILNNAFRRPEDYLRFRMLFQILDLSLLHPDIGRYKSSHLAGSLFCLFASQFIDVPSLYSLMENFIVTIVGPIDEIQPVMAFMGSFMQFNGVIDLPLACQAMSENQLAEHHRCVLNLQTHCPENMKFISGFLKN